MKKTTKRAQHFITAWKDSTLTSIYDAYDNPSQFKVNIEKCIISEMKLCNGFGYTILSYNKFMFICAYALKIDGLNYLRVFTKSNTYDIAL